jgi:hypothetical protein
MAFQSIGDFVCKEQQLTMQLESEQFWSFLGNIDGINSVGNSVGKNDTSPFFLLCFNFFSTAIIPREYFRR